VILEILDGYAERLDTMEDAMVRLYSTLRVWRDAPAKMGETSLWKDGQER
jgi:hypothetical protein